MVYVPENIESYRVRMEFGSTGHDNSGLTDLAGNAYTGTSRYNRYVDTTTFNEAPVITSSETATAIDENIGSGQEVYTIIATDNVGVTSYGIDGTDAADFSVDSTTGVVTLTADPDYETKSSYSFEVRASDATGNTASQTVTLTVNDIDDEEAPVVETAAAAGTITLTMTEEVVNDSASPSDFTVSASVSDNPTVVGITVNGTTVTLTLSDGATFGNGETVTISYSRTSGNISDTSGNVLADFSGILVDTTTLEVDVPEALTLQFTNPVRNTLSINSSDSIRSLSIYSLSGQKMYEKALHNSHPPIDVSTLAQGVYLIKITTEAQQKIAKLVKY